MTEQEWLESASPVAMLDYLVPKSPRAIAKRFGPRARKLRLFACACCRRLFPLLTDERSRAVVEVSERFADGRATANARQAAYAAAFSAHRKANVADDFARTATNATRWAGAVGSAGAIKGMAMYSASEAAKAERLSHEGAPLSEAPESIQANLLRDVLGNPFRPVAMAPSWLAGNEGMAARLAEAIYEERAFERMPILGDALEEAGCDEDEVLRHCREPGEHVRGCWVVDAILGRK